MKKPVLHVTGPHVVLARDDIDTDALYPAEFLTVTTRAGMREYLFADWVRNRNPEANFVAQGQPVTIVVAGRNFGCGSSREHAVWALADYGVQAIVAMSFGDIFRNNCVKNKILAAQISPQHHEHLVQLLHASGSAPTLSLDVATATLSLSTGETWPFTLAAGHAEQLMDAHDEIDRTLRHATALAQYEARLAHTMPWLTSAP